MNKLAGFLGVLAMVAVAPLARADFEILVNSTPCTPTAGTNPGQPAGFVAPNGNLTCPSVSGALFGLPAGVTITDLAVTGLQVPGLFSQELGTTLLVTNTTGATVSITIDIADTDFTMPVTPPPISDSSGATINGTTGTNSLTLTSCVSTNNLFTPCAGAPGEAPANPTLNVTGGATNSNETKGSISALAAPFSLQQHIVLSAGAGSDFNVTTSQVLSSVPEPTSVLLLGGVLLGVTGLLRKRATGS